MVDYARSFFPVILIVLVLRSFLFEPFRIPSDSMMPTLIDGDFIFVNKWRYGLRLPVLNTKIVEIGEPQRGDVIVFRMPTRPVDQLHQAPGRPAGRHIVVRGRQVLRQRHAVPVRARRDVRRAQNEQYPFTRIGRRSTWARSSTSVLYSRTRARRYERGRCRPGHYFLMGDNRNNSRDSRFPEVGFVPEGNLIGKAVASG